MLRELARGRQTEDIAQDFVVSPHTVRSHVKNSMKKLQARTRAQAVAIAMDEGAIELDWDDEDDEDDRARRGSRGRGR